MKTLQIFQCRSCYRYVEYTAEDVVEKRWDQRYVVNCVCNTETGLPEAVFRDLGFNKKQEVEAPPPPPKEEKPGVDKVQRAIETAGTVKKLGSKTAAAKEMGCSPQTVNNYLKYLPADYGTEE